MVSGILGFHVGLLTSLQGELGSFMAEVSTARGRKMGLSCRLQLHSSLCVALNSLHLSGPQLQLQPYGQWYSSTLQTQCGPYPCWRCPDVHAAGYFIIAKDSVCSGQPIPIHYFCGISRNILLVGSIATSHCLHWRRKWQPIPVCLPGEPHGQRSLVGCSPWDRKSIGHDLATKPPPLSS